MKYPAHIYAKALVEVLGDGEKHDEGKIAENFIKLIRRNGDEMHLRKILEEASRFARGKNGLRKVVIDSARSLTPLQKKEVERFLRKEDIVVERTDPSLVAGVKITVNEELQFDGSLKRKLDRAFGI